MNHILKGLAIPFLLSAGAAAQAVPSASRPSVPLPAGDLNYSIRYSQVAMFAQQFGDSQDSVLSADLTYSSGQNRHPLTVTYGGGYMWDIAGPDYGSGLSQHLLLSQALNGNGWGTSFSDNISYSPQAPIVGFTGIPGSGEPEAGSGAGSSGSMQSILTVNTRVLENSTSGQFTRNLNYASKLVLSGSNDILRFPNGGGFDTDSRSASGDLEWRLNARNTISSIYEFLDFSYPTMDFSMQSHSALWGFERSWSRSFKTVASAGPQWLNSSNPTLTPPSLAAAANLSATYQLGRTAGAELDYSRGVSAGAGYMVGAELDTSSATFNEHVGKNIEIGISGSYSRTATLNQGGIAIAKVGTAQVTRSLGRYWSLFATYSGYVQSSSASLPGNTLSQLMQIVGFGIGYSPRHNRSGENQ